MAKEYKMMVTADWHDVNIFNPYQASFLTRSSATARTGAYSFLLSSGINNPYYAQLNFPSLLTEFYLGIGIYPNSITGDDAHFYFRQDSTQQFRLTIYNDGSIKLIDANGAIIASKNIGTGKWFYFEVHAVIGNSNVMQIKINNEIWVDYSTFDSLSGGTGVNNLYMACASHFSNTSVYIDDIKLCTGGWPMVGGLYVLTPTSDGSDNSWTVSTGSDKYACVDEAPATFVDYIYTDAGTLNTKQNFGHSGLQAASYDSIECVCVASKGLLDASGNGSIRNTIKSSGSYGNGASNVLTTSEKYIQDFFSLDPNGNAAWNKTSVNAALPGVETI